MHLFASRSQSDIPSRFLGHEHRETTGINAKADTEMRGKIHKKAQYAIDAELAPGLDIDKSLMEMLIISASRNYPNNMEKV
jgi:hypothetical protein